MWYENEIEGPAIQAYFNDPWTKEDYEIMDIPIPGQTADDGRPGVEMVNFKKYGFAYEGGLED